MMGVAALSGLAAVPAPPAMGVSAEVDGWLLVPIAGGTTVQGFIASSQGDTFVVRRRSDIEWEGPQFLAPRGEASQDQILTGLAAAVEADLLGGTDGSVTASFSPDGSGRWHSAEHALSPGGTYTVPDLTGLAPAAAQQRPPAGTVLAGPGVRLIVVEDAAGTPLAGRVVHLVDRTPPRLSVRIDAGQRPQTTPGGIPYFVAPVAVDVMASASDAVDPAPEVRLWVDGLEGPGPIQREGLHAVDVMVEDASDNVAARRIMFEIRKRPYYEASMAVERLRYDGPAGAITSVDATILLAASEFDARSINLATTQLMLLGQDGGMLSSPAAVEVCPGPCPVPADSAAQAPAKFQDGYWRLTYHLHLPDGLAEVPARIMIAGRSLNRAGASDFDFRSEAPAVEDGPGRDAFVQRHGSSLLSPPPILAQPCIAPQPECEWKFELQNWSPDECNHYDANATSCGLFFDLTQHAEVNLTDYVGKPDGLGWAEDESCLGLATSSCAVIASGRLRMWLEPMPPCTECVIDLRYHARFKARVTVNTPATGVAGGFIQVTGGGLSATAEGAVALGDNAPIEIVIGNDWSIPVQIGSGDSLTLPFSSGVQTKELEACAVSVDIASGGYVAVTADGSNFPLFDMYGYASGLLFDATPDVSITAAVTDGPCQGLTRSEEYP
jgi:hypothetical protein